MVPPAVSTEAVARLERYRWGMWGLAALVYLGVMFERSSGTVVADRVAADFGIPAVALGILGGLQLFTYTLTQVPTGALADTIGPRRMLAAGALLSALGTFIFSQAPVYPVALGGRMLLGFGDSLVFLNILRLQADWFRAREYATLAGLTALSGGIGGVIATAPLAGVVEAWGWRAPLALSSLVLAGIGGAAAIWLRGRPHDAGLPDWREVETGFRSAEPVGPVDRGAGLRRAVRQIAGNRQTYAALFSHLGLFAPYLVLTTVWAVPYLIQAQGLDRTTAGRVVLLAPIGYFTGGPVVGLVSDRLGRRRVPLALVSVGLLATWSVLILAGRLPPLALATLFFAIGFAGGGCLLAFAAAKEANPADYSGLATGITNLGGFGGAALLQILFGRVLDQLWAGTTEAGSRVYPLPAYQVALGLLAGATLIGLLANLRLRERPVAPPISA